MGVSILKTHDKFNHVSHIEFLLDTDNDKDNLPGLEVCAPGSEAYSIQSGKKFILNNAGAWSVKLGE